LRAMTVLFIIGVIVAALWIYLRLWGDGYRFLMDYGGDWPKVRDRGVLSTRAGLSFFSAVTVGSLVFAVFWREVPVGHVGEEIGGVSEHVLLFFLRKLLTLAPSLASRGPSNDHGPLPVCVHV
jgi:hypothetical protein